ncbi:MAG: hypothetical protein AAGJ81_05870 [Verrucomicrobiota bacterium]
MSRQVLLIVCSITQGLIAYSNPNKQGPNPENVWLDYINEDISPSDLRTDYRKRGIATNHAELFGAIPPSDQNGWKSFSDGLDQLYALRELHENLALSDRNHTRENGFANVVNEARAILESEEVKSAISLVETAVTVSRWIPLRNWELGADLIAPEIEKIRIIGEILSAAYKLSIVAPNESAWSSSFLLQTLVKFSQRVANDGLLISFLSGVHIRQLPVKAARWAYSRGAPVAKPPSLNLDLWKTLYTRCVVSERILHEISFERLRNGETAEMIVYALEEGGISTKPKSDSQRTKMLEILDSEEGQYMKCMELISTERPELIEKTLELYLRQNETKAVVPMIAGVGFSWRKLNQLVIHQQAWVIAEAIEKHQSIYGYYPPNLESTDAKEILTSDFEYQSLDDGDAYLLFPTDPYLLENAVFELSSIVWFPSSMDVEEARQILTE